MQFKTSKIAMAVGRSKSAPTTTGAKSVYRSTAVALTLGLTSITTSLSAYANDGLFMRTGSRTTQPIGHFDYCKSHLADCNRVSLVFSPMELTRKRWQQLVEVNYQANSTVEPVADSELYGEEEVWTLPTNKGDCEDYVLLKRKKLMEMGWPAATLLITVVRRPNGEGHAVLTARTDRGDYILDNLVDKISAWHATPYTYLKRQAANHSGYWVSINDTDNSKRVVASNNVPVNVAISDISKAPKK